MSIKTKTLSVFLSVATAAVLIMPLAASAYTWSTNLKLGSTGADVMELQKFLNTDTATKIASSGAGSPGSETSYFGGLTKAAVIKFQNKYASEVLTPLGLTVGTGNFFAASRAKMNTLSGGVVTPGVTPPAPQGKGMTVTAGVQPTASIAPAGVTRVPFTVVNFTASSDGDVTVNSIVVERTGLAADAVLSGIILIDENGVQLGLEKTLNSAHQVTLTEPFVVKAGTTRTMVLAANRAAFGASAHGGEVAYLSLVAVNTSATVNGTLPISGTGQTINETLVIGSVTNTRGPLDPGTTATKEVGTTGYTFSSIKVTAGSAEKVRMLSIRWNQSGSAASSDLANVKTYVDGTAYGTTISSDGKYFTSTFGTGIVIDKGYSSEIYIKGDIVGGSVRTVQFDVYKTTDLYLKGETYGYGIAPATAGTGFGTGNPWYTGLAVTISSGSLSVSKSTAIAAQNVAINLEKQVLGGFDVEAKGEAVSVGSLVATLTITNSGGSIAPIGTDIDNVALYDENGAVVAGPVDATGAALVGTVTFTDTITFPVGKHTYTLKGKLTTTSTEGFESNDTIVMSTQPSSGVATAVNWTTVKGQNTGVTIYATPYTAITANTITVKAGALDVSVSSFPLAQTVIAGVTQFTFANYVLNAGNSGEDLAFNSIKLNYVATSSAQAAKLSNCKLYDGTLAITTGSNAVTPTAAASGTPFAFDNQLTIPKGTSKTLALKCDIAGDTWADTTFMWGYGFGGSTDATIMAYISPTGKVSGQAITETFPATASAGGGQLMTVASKGTYTVVDDSTPGYNIVSSGTTGVTLLKLKFIAASEDIDIYKVDLHLANLAATSSRSDLASQTVTFYDAANPTVALATAQFNQADIRFASSTSIAPGAFRIPAGSTRSMLVKGDIAAINATQGPLTASGDLLQVEYLASDGGTNGNYGKGVSSGTTINDGTTVAVTATGVRIMRSYPTVAKIDLSTSEKILQVGAGRPMYKFSIKANGGDVYMYKFNFDVSSTTAYSATTTAFGLYTYTDSAFSLADSTFSSDGLINAGTCVNGLGVGSSTLISLVNQQYPAVQNGMVAIYPDKGATGAGCNSATTTYKIPSGETRWFKLTATVNRTRITAGSEYINVDLRGDAAFPVSSLLTMGKAGAITPITGMVNFDTNNDFIWSPNSTSSVNALSDLDWTNGYGVPGLSTLNLPAETLTFTY